MAAARLRSRSASILATAADLDITRNSSLTRVRPLFEQLLQRDPTGREWLPEILAGTSAAYGVAETHGVGMLEAELLEGWHHKDNRLGVKVWMRRCSEHPPHPSYELLEFCLLHPERLEWPLKGGIRDERMGPETLKMRKALILDEPPRRALAQELGLRLLRERDQRRRSGSGGRSRARQRWTVCCAQTVTHS